MQRTERALSTRRRVMMGLTTAGPVGILAACAGPGASDTTSVPKLDLKGTAIEHWIQNSITHPEGVAKEQVMKAFTAQSGSGITVTSSGGQSIDKVVAALTNRGRIATPVVVNCTAGWATLVADMVGVRLPIVTHPLQAAVTEPVKPFLGPVVVSGTLHVYVSQTDRGELVFGASTDPYTSYSTRGSLEFTEELAGHVLELMPSIAQLRVLRQWSGLCDITPDFSPLMGVTPVDGFFVDVGWGTYGFKAGPVAGEAMAELLASGKTPEIIAGFDLARFPEGRLVGEKGAAAVGH